MRQITSGASVSPYAVWSAVTPQPESHRVRGRSHSARRGFRVDSLGTGRNERALSVVRMEACGVALKNDGPGPSAATDVMAAGHEAKKCDGSPHASVGRGIRMARADRSMVVPPVRSQLQTSKRSLTPRSMFSDESRLSCIRVRRSSSEAMATPPGGPSCPLSPPRRYCQIRVSRTRSRIRAALGAALDPPHGGQKAGTVSCHLGLVRLEDKANLRAVFRRG